MPASSHTPHNTSILPGNLTLGSSRGYPPTTTASQSSGGFSAPGNVSTPQPETINRPFLGQTMFVAISDEVKVITVDENGVTFSGTNINTGAEMSKAAIYELRQEWPAAFAYMKNRHDSQYPNLPTAVEIFIQCDKDEKLEGWLLNNHDLETRLPKIIQYLAECIPDIRLFMNTIGAIMKHISFVNIGSIDEGSAILHYMDQGGLPTYKLRTRGGVTGLANHVDRILRSTSAQTTAMERAALAISRDVIASWTSYPMQGNILYFNVVEVSGCTEVQVTEVGTSSELLVLLKYILKRRPFNYNEWAHRVSYRPRLVEGVDVEQLTYRDMDRFMRSIFVLSLLCPLSASLEF